MKYESPITCHSKDMANVKVFDWLIVYGFTSRSRIFHLYGDVTIASEVFEMWVKHQGQGHMVKTFGTNRKVLS
jgi:hypothetical protein